MFKLLLSATHITLAKYILASKVLAKRLYRSYTPITRRLISSASLTVTKTVVSKLPQILPHRGFEYTIPKVRE